MKKLSLFILCILFLCGCQKTLTATEVTQAFTDANLPITNITTLTVDNDPNELLGRPNQYIEKVFFADTRLKDEGLTGADLGGTIEVFKNSSDMQKRKKYVDTVTQSASMFAEYSYGNGVLLLRLSHRLTPDQAKEYEDVFMKLP
jgi:hypothetical protein